MRSTLKINGGAGPPLDLDKEAIRASSPIERVIGETVELKRRGRRLEGLCPFHDDHRPSLHVDPRTGRWFCSPCGISSADVFDWVQRRDGVDFTTALRTLSASNGTVAPNPKKRSTAKRAKPQRPALRLSNAEAMAKLKAERLLDDATIEHFGIEPDHEQPAWRYPAKGGFRYKAYESKPKYWSDGGLENQLYRIDDVPDSTERLIWVNGEPAVWQCWQAGVPAVCGFGEGHVPPDAGERLKTKGVRRVVVVPDRGDTGADLARRTVKSLKGGGLSVVIAELPASVGGDGSDLGDLFVSVNGNATTFRQALAEMLDPQATWADLQNHIGPVEWDWPRWLPRGLLAMPAAASPPSRCGSQAPSRAAIPGPMAQPTTEKRARSYGARRRPRKP